MRPRHGLDFTLLALVFGDEEAQEGIIGLAIIGAFILLCFLVYFAPALFGGTWLGIWQYCTSRQNSFSCTIAMIGIVGLGLLLWSIKVKAPYAFGTIEVISGVIVSWHTVWDQTTPYWVAGLFASGYLLATGFENMFCLRSEEQEHAILLKRLEERLLAKLGDKHHISPTLEDSSEHNSME